MVAIRNEAGPGPALREVGRLHVRAQRQLVGCGETSLAQCHILGELWRAGVLPMTELGRRLGVHKGWVSRGVRALTDEGLLARGAQEGDGRVVMVALSKAGRARAAALQRALDAQASRVLARVPARERAGVARALVLLSGALREELEAAARGRGGASRAPRRRISP